MKKNTFKYYFMAALVLVTAQAWAEESMPKDPNLEEYDMQEAGLSPALESRPEQREMRDGGGMEKMKGGAGKGMMHRQPSVVATSDGGIVILDGPRLLKYDAQLNLIGEAELKPGKKGPQVKRDEQKPMTEEAPMMDEPAVELPAVENPA